MEQLYRFHNRMEGSPWSVHDHQLMVAALLGKTGELRTQSWSSEEVSLGTKTSDVDAHDQTHPSMLEHDIDFNLVHEPELQKEQPKDDRIHSQESQQQVYFTMRRRSLNERSERFRESGKLKSKFMRPDGSPWMCYVHQVWHPWITVGDFIPDRVHPKAAKQTGALLPKDVARLLSKQQLILNASLQGFTTQPMKELEPYLYHFYGMTQEGSLVKRVPESIYIENLLTPTVLAGFYADVGRLLGRDELLFEVSHWKHDLSSLHRMSRAFQKVHGWSLEPRVWEDSRLVDDEGSRKRGDNSTKKSYYLVLASKDRQEFLQYIAKDLLLMGLMSTIRYYPLRQKVRKWGKTSWQRSVYKEKRYKKA